MTDIVEELREGCYWHRTCRDCSKIQFDAADEIERLRKRNEELLAELQLISICSTRVLR